MPSLTELGAMLSRLNDIDRFHTGGPEAEAEVSRLGGPYLHAVLSGDGATAGRWVRDGRSPLQSLDAALDAFNLAAPNLRARLDFDERPRCFLYEKNRMTIGANGGEHVAYADAPTMPLALAKALITALGRPRATP